MRKSKFLKRLRDAVDAFMGRPVLPLATLRPPRYTAEELNLFSVASTVTIPKYDSDSEMQEAAKEAIAKNIGRELLNRGWIEFTEDKNSLPFDVAIRGRVRVAAPKKE